MLRSFSSLLALVALLAACGDDAASTPLAVDDGGAGDSSVDGGLSSDAALRSDGSSSDAFSGDGGPCAVQRHSIASPDGSTLIAVDPAGVIYSVSKTAIYSFSSSAPSPKVLFAGPVWATASASTPQAITTSTHLYVPTDAGLLRFSTSTGTKELVSSELVYGGMVVEGAFAYYTNTNGEVRRLDLGSLPATSTIFAKQGLDYQNAYVAVAGTNLIVGDGNGVYMLPLGGGARTQLWSPAGKPPEYLYGFGGTSTHAFVSAFHFNSTHAGIGRLALDGSSGGAVDWFSNSGGDDYPFHGMPSQSNHAPLVAGGIVLAMQTGALQAKITLQRQPLPSGTACVFDTFAVTQVLNEAASGHTFAWADTTQVVWYDLP
jgi:hypothetical protein